MNFGSRLAIGVLVVLAWTSVARAESTSTAFTFARCDDAATIERLARLELRAEAGARANATQIDVVCEPHRASLRVDDPITGKRVERDVSLAGIEAASRARLLALAIAELVRASWIELELRSTPVLPVLARIVVPTREVEAARDVARAPPSPHSWNGVVSFVAGETSRFDPLFGASVGATYVVRGPWFVGASATALFGAAHRSSGQVGVTELTLDLAWGWRASFVDVALGARLGWGALSGAPDPGAVHGAVRGWLAGPVASTTVRIGGPARLSVSAGWLGVGVRGRVAGDTDVALSGPWASVALGVGF